MRAQEEHQQAIIVADALADAVAFAVEHRLGRSVDRAVEGEIDQPQRRSLHRRIPRRCKRPAIGRAPQPVAGGRRHLHLDRGLRDRAGIREHADEALLRGDRPAIAPRLAADRHPVIVGEIEILGHRRLHDLDRAPAFWRDDGQRIGRVGRGNGDDVEHDIERFGERFGERCGRGARGFRGHPPNGSGRRRVGQRFRGVLDFLREECGVGASIRCERDEF